ncbi:protein of unknown function [Rhodovastum atsumiense]|nr:protein of unknown function [Rhodovastum atsumiense]
MSRDSVTTSDRGKPADQGIGFAISHVMKTKSLLSFGTQRRRCPDTPFGGALPRTRPGGSASWTSAKGFTLGTQDSVPRSENGIQGPCGPLRDGVPAHDVSQGQSPCLS